MIFLQNRARAVEQKYKNENGSAFCGLHIQYNKCVGLCSYRRQLVKAGEEFIQSHHQLLRCALGCQTGETLDVCK